MADIRIISHYYISLFFHPFYFIKAHYAFILDTILINIFFYLISGSVEIIHGKTIMN